MRKQDQRAVTVDRAAKGFAQLFHSDARSTLNTIREDIEGGLWPPSALRAASWHRSVHTIKGNASFFSIPKLEEICRRIEMQLAILRAGCDQEISKISLTDLLEGIENLEAALLSAEDSSDSQSLKANQKNSFSKLCDEMQGLVLQLATSCGKDVELVIAPGDCPIDLKTHAALHAALVQILRNAIDHGIESPQDRITLGKAPRGRIDLSLEKNEDSISILIQDDGAGLERENLLLQARAAGFLEPGDRDCNDEELYDFIFEHGFSIAAKGSALSGCGVGLDIVRHRLKELGGRVCVKSKPGQGCLFTLTLMNCHEKCC